jgi:hypothetical protein
MRLERDRLFPIPKVELTLIIIRAAGLDHKDQVPHDPGIYRLSRLNRAADNGRKIAITKSGKTTASSKAFSLTHEFPFQPGFMKSLLTAAAVTESGFQAAMAPSHAGIVFGSTKMLERKPIGQTSI